MAPAGRKCTLFAAGSLAVQRLPVQGQLLHTRRRPAGWPCGNCPSVAYPDNVQPDWTNVADTSNGLLKNRDHRPISKVTTKERWSQQQRPWMDEIFFRIHEPVRHHSSWTR